MRLQDRVVLLTGARRGVDAACAEACARGGADVAVVNFGLGTDRDWRIPDILADATLELLARDPRECGFRAWTDEEVLRELAGVDDFAPYRRDPDHEPDPHSILLVDPDWTR